MENMICSGLRVNNWAIKEQQTAPVSRGRAAAVVELGDPYWVADFEYEQLTNAQYKALTAWIARRRGAGVPFYGWQFANQAPLLHPAATNDEGNLQNSVTTVSDGELALRVPVSGVLILSEGDVIGYDGADGEPFMGLVERMIDDGNPLSNVVQTRPQLVTPADPIAMRVKRAYALMRLDPESVDLIEPVGAKPGSVSFSARQAGL